MFKTTPSQRMRRRRIINAAGWFSIYVIFVLLITVLLSTLLSGFFHLAEIHMPRKGILVFAFLMSLIVAFLIKEMD